MKSNVAIRTVLQTYIYDDSQSYFYVMEFVMKFDCSLLNDVDWPYSSGVICVIIVLLMSRAQVWATFTTRCELPYTACCWVDGCQEWIVHSIFREDKITLMLCKIKRMSSLPIIYLHFQEHGSDQYAWEQNMWLRMLAYCCLNQAAEQWPLDML